MIVLILFMVTVSGNPDIEVIKFANMETCRAVGAYRVRSMLESGTYQYVHYRCLTKEGTSI